MTLFDSPHLLTIHGPGESFNLAVMERIRLLSNAAIEKTGRFNLVLAGGSTPKALYQCIAEETYRSQFTWQQIQIFFGDERGVPHDHPHSNYRMVKESLLTKIDIPTDNIHPLPVDQGSASISTYETLLRHELPCPADTPEFDLILLGLGSDGHIASLFPNTPALDERDRLVLGYPVDNERGWRITLTFPVLEQAKQVIMLVTGTGKQAILERLKQGDQTGDLLPIERLAAVRPLEWHIDADAADLILRKTN